MNAWPGYGGPSGIMYQPQSHLYAPSPHMYAPPAQVYFNPAGTSHRGQQILSGFPPGSYIVARQPTIPSQLQSQWQQIPSTSTSQISSTSTSPAYGSDMPTGWQKHHHDQASGRDYLYNSQTRVSSWDFCPVCSDLASAAEGNSARHGAPFTSSSHVTSSSDTKLGQQVRLQRIQIAGDGRCLFRSIARAMAVIDNPWEPMSAEQEKQKADALRALAHKTISVDRKTWFESKGVIEGNFKEYCQQMKQPHFFGGEAELVALSGSLQRAITVFMPDMQGEYRSIAEYGTEHSGNGKLIRVLYNGKNHYDCLIKC